MKWRAKPLICFWLSHVVFLSRAWKNTGMTMTCNRCPNKQRSFEPLMCLDLKCTFRGVYVPCIQFTHMLDESYYR